MDNQALKVFFPTLEVLYRIVSLTREHEELIEKLTSVFWDGTSTANVMQYVQRGTLFAFGLSNGLVLLETIDRPVGRELFIYGMIGRDILSRGEAIVRDLKELANYWECNLIGGEGIPKGWQRAAPNLGFKPVSTHFVMEL